jgi:GT2 family glycosyltransferase
MKDTGEDPEIIVVDCETPNIRDWLSSRFPSVKLIHFDEDIGLGRARNEGIRFASHFSKYLAFVDNDTVVVPDWAKILIQALEGDPTVGAAQSRILLNEDPRLLDHAGLALDLLGTWVTTQGRSAKTLKPTKQEIMCASTAATIVRRSVFEEIGGFDPYISVCDEDTDLSWRVWLAGERVIIVPDAVAYHSRGFERDLTLRRIYYSVKNRPYIIAKNSEGMDLILGVSLFEFLSFISAIALIITRRSSEARMVFMGIYHTAKAWPAVWNAHVRTCTRRKIRNSYLFSKGLLRRDIAATVWDISSKISSFPERRRSTPLSEKAIQQSASHEERARETKVRA